MITCSIMWPFRCRVMKIGPFADANVLEKRATYSANHLHLVGASIIHKSVSKAFVDTKAQSRGYIFQIFSFFARFFGFAAFVATLPLDLYVYLFHLACGWIVAQKVSSKGPRGVLFHRNWPLNAQINSMSLQILLF